MSKAATTLRPLISEYVKVRRARGEFVRETGQAVTYTLLMLDDSFGSRPLNNLNLGALDRWMATWGALSPTTRRLRISHVKGFCRWLVASKRIKSDPTAGLPVIPSQRKVPITLQHREVFAVLNVCPDRRATAIVWLMVGMGLRCCEVSRANLADYDRDALILTIVNGKGGHQRKLPVTADAAEAINAYLNEVGWVAGPLIRNQPNWGRPGAGFGRLHPRTLGKLLWTWMTEAGVKQAKFDGKSAHSLRRTCASDVMDVSKDVRVVQEMLGHARVETTMIYLRPVGLDKLRDAMEGRTYGPLPLAVAGS